MKKLIQSPENKSSALYEMNLHRFFQYCLSLNSIFLVIYYITISYDTVNYQNLTIFSSESPQHYMLMNNTKIVVINQLWYQMIRNDESNNFIIENYFPKIIFIPQFVQFLQNWVKN